MEWRIKLETKTCFGEIQEVEIAMITFTTSPMVHACDDRSVMESHESHGAIIRTVRRIAGDLPFAVGPSAIGVRDNPYGAAAKANPDNIRQAMNWNDPRQHGLLGAAWALGYFSDFAGGGAAAVILGGATGPFGVVAGAADYPQPWFDSHSGLYPGLHVLRGLSRLRSAPLHDLRLPASGPVAGIATMMPDGFEVWVANMRATPTEITFQSAVKGVILDADNFTTAAQRTTFMDHLHDLPSTLNLDAFAVARVLIGN